MKEDRFYELVSDLTVAIRATEKGCKPLVRARPQRRKQAAGSPDLFPQVVIYIREAFEHFQPSFVSDNVTSQLGYHPEDFIQDSLFWADRIHPEDAPRVLEAFSEVLRTGHLIQTYRFLRENGSYAWIRDEQSLVRENGDSPGEILGSWIDVTESRETEEEREQILARRDSLIGSSPLGMVSFDSNGEIIESNPAASNILGFPFQGQMDFPDLFTMLPVVECGISEAIFRCLESGEGGVGQLQYRSKTDRDVYVKMHVKPVKDAKGTITGAHAFVEDVSDRRRAEELLVRSERLKVLGQIAGGVSHNFNNLLQILSGNANMALTNLQLKDYGGLQNNLNQILESTRSATEVVRWLQQFGREQRSMDRPQKEVFDLSDVVEEAIQMCKLWSKAELERNNIPISYELDLTPGCYVSGVPDQLSWVVMNFLKNSLEAMPAGGIVKVRSYIKGNRVILSVADNGIGIPPEDIKNLARPFWSSKVGHAGMGLAFNGEIMRRHGGTMGVRRGKPHGAVFKVRLLYIKDPSEERKALAEQSIQKGYRILLVDDEVPVVRMFEKGLKTAWPHGISYVFS